MTTTAPAYVVAMSAYRSALATAEKRREVMRDELRKERMRGTTNQEIARNLGVTAQRVSQLVR